MQRQYSVRSQVTVDTLEQLELEVLEMQTLQAEAEQKTEQARFQLGVLAGQGDKRARSMLEALQRGEPIE